MEDLFYEKKITVHCNYPTPENWDEFQSRYCTAMVTALSTVLTPEDMMKGLEALIRREEMEKQLSKSSKSENSSNK